MSAHPELLLVSALLRRKDYAVIAEQGISKEYFVSYFEEYSWIEKYFLTHRTLPSTNAFKTTFPETKLYKKHGGYKSYIKKMISNNKK